MKMILYFFFEGWGVRAGMTDKLYFFFWVNTSRQNSEYPPPPPPPTSPRPLPPLGLLCQL